MKRLAMLVALALSAPAAYAQSGSADSSRDTSSPADTGAGSEVQKDDAPPYSQPAPDSSADSDPSSRLGGTGSSSDSSNTDARARLDLPSGRTDRSDEAAGDMERGDPADDRNNE